MCTITLKYLLIIALLANFSEAFHWPSRSKVNISITNTFYHPNTNLTVNCKSKHKDLNIHVIPNGETYEFTVKNRIWGSTFYYCRFSFDDKSYNFKVYNQKTDKGLCLGHCRWEMTEEYPFLITYNDRGERYGHFFYWDEFESDIRRILNS
ncbi:hypothetical protein RND81_08G225400 [Saponaria officinalis]|uniref:S-protein homolog n=1 Tax=Saponaria officinalis TaxID=3572 RepID=A0AAW1JB34_SAPOF